MPKANHTLKHAAKHTRWTPTARIGAHSDARSPARSSSVRASTPRSAPQKQVGADKWTLSWLKRWDKGTGTWITVDDATFPFVPPLLAPRLSHNHTRLSFMTYNTFSSNPSHSRAQSLALASLITNSGCALVALQEISLSFYRFLLSHPPFRKSGYAISTPEEYWRASGRGSATRGKEGAREACVVLVKEGLLGRGSEVRVGRLGRGRDEGGKAAIGVRVVSGGKEVLRLATSHFSSLPFNAHLRARQFRTCLAFLSQRFPSPTSSDEISREDTTQAMRVLLGDFNASNGAEFDALTSDSSLALVDAFDLLPSRLSSNFLSKKGKEHSRAHRHEEQGDQGDSSTCPPTFGHLYPWIRPPSTLKTRTPKPRKVRRIDRVYISSTSGVRLHRYEHRGGDPLEGETDECGKDGRAFASDHEAVVVEVHLPVKC